MSGAIRALELLGSSCDLLTRLQQNTAFFRQGLQQRDIDLLPGTHAIIPIMLYDAATALEFANRMLQKGIYVLALYLFSVSSIQSASC